MDDIEDIRWTEGYEAAAGGYDVDECPYEGEEKIYWVHGWKWKREEETNQY